MTHLGHILAENLDDSADIIRETRHLLCKAIILYVHFRLLIPLFCAHLSSLFIFHCMVLSYGIYRTRLLLIYKLYLNITQSSEFTPVA